MQDPRPTVADRARQWLNLAFLPFCVGFMVGYSPGGEDVGSVARAHEPLLAAAGWAFAIWGVIFAGHIAYAGYQLLPSQAARSLHRRIGWWILANSLGAALWVFTFTHRAFGLAWAIILGLVVVLAVIDSKMSGDALRGRDYLLVRLPFALNFGWVSVASTLATAQYLGASLDYAPSLAMTVVASELVIAAATVVAVMFIVVRRNHAYALAVAWGLAGIAAYRHDSVPSLAAVAAGGAALLVVLASSVAIAVRRRRTRRGLSGPPLGWLDGRITHR